ncbi:hypothetical protein [Pedobacter sp. L105]|uniref:hypothetical protein n=1 Tax=Pedobacter sp. L105 TaxID=1641871 RepID=UPI0020B1054F|nr:hypothetical protein [Pedobacter sp. L105]
MWYKYKGLRYTLAGIFFFLMMGCKEKHHHQTAFYYWKTSFALSHQQEDFLKGTASNRIYLRFFDVIWDDHHHQAVPNAILTVKQNIKGLTIFPVVYITNKTFTHTSPAQTDSLALKVNQLINRLAEKYQISYKSIQIDCDWTTGTRTSYFSFLKALKRYNHHQLEATIRLHQVKYPEQTGIPPVDQGVLMFYNMGKLSAGLTSPNSIYNAGDAEKYISSLTHYPLPLSVALPLFSWAVQIRAGKIIQIYGQIDRKELIRNSNFEVLGNSIGYRAKKSFYLDGIYIMAQDVFKIEDVDAGHLNAAAKQLSEYLPPLNNRNIIYYEISSVNLSSFTPKVIMEVSAHF